MLSGGANYARTKGTVAPSLIAKMWKLKEFADGRNTGFVEVGTNSSAPNGALDSVSERSVQRGASDMEAQEYSLISAVWVARNTPPVARHQIPYYQEFLILDVLLLFCRPHSQHDHPFISS